MKKKTDISVLNQAIGLHKAGKSQRYIAQVLHISKSCVQNSIKRFDERNTLEHKRGAGRKRETTIRENRMIERIASIHKKRSIKFIHGEVQRAKIDVSVATVYRRLREMGFDSHTSVKKQFLTKKHRAKRLEWCKKHQNWTVSDWKKVIFSDESNFKPFERKNKQCVWFRDGVDNVEDLIQVKMQGGGGSIGIWGCISVKVVGCSKIYNGTINSDRYIDVIHNELIPSSHLWFIEGDEWIFQQDNASAHTSKRSTECFLRNKIELLGWPANSPDLNPIEQCWSIIDSRLKNQDIRTVDSFKVALKAEFDKISAETCEKLFDSMPERIEKCIKSKGGHFTCERRRNVPIIK